MSDTDFEARYLSGAELYGETLTDEKLQDWLNDQLEGYADLGGTATTTDIFEYDMLNRHVGWGLLPDRRWRHALGIGSATGIEFMPIKDQVDRISIVEPSLQLRARKVDLPIDYADPAADGTLPFPDATFDLAVCFGVLHHIAKVSTVLNEISRCLEPGGYVLLREPIVSLGDWRQPRPRLTRDERGIPIAIFRSLIADAGLTVLSERLNIFSPIGRLRFLGPNGPYSSKLGVRIDAVACSLLRWNTRYHATSFVQKLRPTCVGYVLRKPL